MARLLITGPNTETSAAYLLTGQTRKNYAGAALINACFNDATSFLDLLVGATVPIISCFYALSVMPKHPM